MYSFKQLNCSQICTYYMQLGINITNCEYYCCDLETPTINTVCCFSSDGLHMDFTWIASIVIPIFVFIVLFFLLLINIINKKKHV